ncbi:MAG: nucleotidyltransferase domain-containing protein [Nitrososphaera sp.]|nr:nucleotidyltransferase domain-containing protein [Nitrososphaera sp.]
MIEPELAIPQDKLEAICTRYAVHELAIFGSAVTATFGSESDVDLLVEFEPEAHVGFLMLSRLQRELSSLLNRPVDLVPKKGLKEHVKNDVLASAKVLYAA